MAEAASISYGNEFSSEPRKSPLNKHIPESSKVRKTHHPWRGLVVVNDLECEQIWPSDMSA